MAPSIRSSRTIAAGASPTEARDTSSRSNCSPYYLFGSCNPYGGSSRRCLDLSTGNQSVEDGWVSSYCLGFGSELRPAPSTPTGAPALATAGLGIVYKAKQSRFRQNIRSTTHCIPDGFHDNTICAAKSKSNSFGTVLNPTTRPRCRKKTACFRCAGRAR